MGHPKLELLASNGVHIGHVIQYVKVTLTSCSMTHARPNPATLSLNELMTTHRYGSWVKVISQLSNVPEVRGKRCIVEWIEPLPRRASLGGRVQTQESTVQGTGISILQMPPSQQHTHFAPGSNRQKPNRGLVCMPPPLDGEILDHRMGHQTCSCNTSPSNHLPTAYKDRDGHNTHT